MKKLIIAAALVCAAAFAQAAAIDWSASGILDPVATAAAGKNTAGVGWLGYVILSANHDTVVADLATGNTDSLIAAAVGPVKTTTNKGQFTTSAATGSIAAGEQTFYLIVLNSTTVGGATAFYTASATETIDASLDTTVNFGSQTTNTKVAGNWTAMGGSPEPIPEPTSGLLVLLGVAGLALRRRA